MHARVAGGGSLIGKDLVKGTGMSAAVATVCYAIPAGRYLPLLTVMRASFITGRDSRDRRRGEYDDEDDYYRRGGEWGPAGPACLPADLVGAFC